MSDSYSILDIPASPVYGLLETVSGFPGIEDTGFADWLESAPIFAGARTFREEEPGWALGADILASFIPYVGWGTALNRAAAAGRVSGLLGATNRAGRLAAGAFPRTPALAFAAGETVRYAPVSAALTGIDVLGGRYTDPWDALLGFGVGTALGAGFQAAGSAVAPAISRWGARSLAQAQVVDPNAVRTIPYLIGESWNAVFEPGPQLSALYGFSTNQRNAAGQMARSPRVQEAAAPGLEPQLAAREWDAIRREKLLGQHPDIDLDIVNAQYDQSLRAIVGQRPDPATEVFEFGPDERPFMRTEIEDALRFEGDGKNENIVRMPLTGVGDSIENPDNLAKMLDLPENWLPEMKWPGVTYVAINHTDQFAKRFGFTPSQVGKNFRQVLRTDSNVKNKVWTVRRDPGSDQWLVSTRIPGSYTMGARAKVEKFSHLSPRDEAHAYFTFKTDRPGRFFPDSFADTDNANPDSFWYDKAKIPKIRQSQIDAIVRRAASPGRDVPRNPFPADKVEIAYPRSGAPVGAALATADGALTSGSTTYRVRKNLDYVLDDGAGNQWVVRKDIFDKTYKKLRSGKFQKRDDFPVGYFVAEADGVVNSLEGPNPYSKGDYILIGPAGEMWNQTPERFAQRYTRPMKSLLDTVMDFHDVYLSPNTIKEIYGAWSPSRREAFVKSILSSPGVGEQLFKGIEKYAAPTIQQLKNSPEGRAILGMTQSTFEAAEDRARLVLYGHAQLGPEQSPMSALFGGAEITNSTALVPQLRRTLQDDPAALDQIRRFLAGQVEAASLAGTPAGQWIDLAKQQNLLFVRDGNQGIDALRSVGASDARPIPILEENIGISRKWDGSILYPIYREGAVQPEAKIAGHSQQQALRKADEWIAAANADDAAKGRAPANYRKGLAFIPNETETVPAWVKNSELAPGLLDPRTNMRGFEHEFEPYKHVDEFVAELEENYIRRARYFGGAYADALTTGRMHQLRVNDPHAFSIVNTRVTQIKGIPGPMEQRFNQIVDSVAAPLLGTNSVTKAADAMNQTMFHLLHGAGNIVTPLLNLTSWFQTLMPAMVEWKTSSIPLLKEAGFHFPNMGPDGLARPGFSWVNDMPGLMWGGIREALDPSETTREVFKVLPQRRELAGSLANDYLGQDNEWRRRASEGIRGPEDFAFWLEKSSAFLMQKSEQLSRTLSATTMLKAMDQFEAATGKKFTMQQRIDNAANMVTRTNYAYFKQDRPMMYTSPAGAIFGNQKTWMTNYLWMMAHYAGLALREKNIAPLAFSVGTTAILGGAFAVPLLGSGIDAVTETFADKDGREFIFDKFGQGGNAISFGLPALFGMSLHGNVAAPGSNLAHDAEFFFSIVALERAKLLGRAIGTAWEDQITLGMNPMRDEIFRRQAAQALAPRAIYRGFQALMSDELTSAATGYPLVRELGWGSRIMTGLGFTPTEVAIQYSAYDSLLKDKAEMRRQISAYGEAYAVASINQDRQEMTRLLQRAAIMGLDQSAIMQSAHVRMRSYGRDMFGRNFTGEQLEEYQETLRQAGRGTTRDN